MRVPTRMRPKRIDELIGGSLHWIVKHRLIGRQQILRFDDRKDGRIDIVLSGALELIPPSPTRAHQGWRYLEAAKYPPRMTTAAASPSFRLGFTAGSPRSRSSKSACRLSRSRYRAHNQQQGGTHDDLQRQSTARSRARDAQASLLPGVDRRPSAARHAARLCPAIFPPCGGVSAGGQRGPQRLPRSRRPPHARRKSCRGRGHRSRQAGPCDAVADVRLRARRKRGARCARRHSTRRPRR